jgi:hypothetical protein
MLRTTKPIGSCHFTKFLSKSEEAVIVSSCRVCGWTIVALLSVGMVSPLYAQNAPESAIQSQTQNPSQSQSSADATSYRISMKSLLIKKVRRPHLRRRRRSLLAASLQANRPQRQADSSCRTMQMQWSSSSKRQSKIFAGSRASWTKHPLIWPAQKANLKGHS